MMQNSLHKYRVAADPVENSVAAVNLAARAFAKVGSSFSGKGMSAQQFESCSEAASVVISNVIPESLSAEFADPREITTRCCADFNFSHAANGARR